MTTAAALAADCLAGADPAPPIEVALARAAADPLGAVIRCYPESATTQLDQLRARLRAGERPPLAGVPVLIKDNLCYHGHPSEACSRILQGYRSPYSATAVERLIAAGAIVIGATNMDEFAMGSSNETSIHGPVRNPHDPTRIPGGSSGGSAAAVASGIVPVSLGSDTGGSIRQPAALCGCFGLKPTYGRVSRHGLLAFGSSLDQIGPLAADLNDLKLVLRAISGHDPQDATSVARPAEDLEGEGVADLSGLRIGYVPDHAAQLDPAMAAHLETAKQRAAARGAELIAIDLPHERYAVAIYYIIATGEASSNLARYDGVHYGYRAAQAEDLHEVYCRSRGEGFGTEVKRRIMLGTYVLSAGYYDAYYKKAMQVRRLVCQDFAAAFQRCDLILGLTSPSTAFKAGEKTNDPLAMYLSDVFTIAANLAGLPALSLPFATHDDGLPVGLHLQAPQWHEQRLLSTAAQLRT